MRLALLSDIHANLHARKTALQAGLRTGDAIAFGHTHKPWSRVVDGIRFVNTGSVGRPKDGDPRAGYAIIECSGNGPPPVEFVRVPYSVMAAKAALEEGGLPGDFGLTLESGLA